MIFYNVDISKDFFEWLLTEYPTIKAGEDFIVNRQWIPEESYDDTKWESLKERAASAKQQRDEFLSNNYEFKKLSRQYKEAKRKLEEHTNKLRVENYPDPFKDEKIKSS